MFPGSIGYLVQPLGSLLSAFITGKYLFNSFDGIHWLQPIVSSFYADPLGRRRSMMFVNVPFFFGWYMLYQASCINEILIGFVMLGLAVGLLEAPVVTYLGEIW